MLNSKTVLAKAAAMAGFVLFGATSPSTSWAADTYVEPQLVQVSTPTYQPDFQRFDPPLGTYTYGVFWQGIPAATATVTIDQDGPSFKISALAKTAQAIDLFYTLRYQAEGTLSAFDFQPEKTVIRNQEGSRIRNVDMSFLADGEVFVTRSQNNNKPATLLRFNPHNNMLDPFSAAFLARSLSWERGSHYEFDTFNGKSRYLIGLTVVDEATVTMNGHTSECWVVKPTVKNLTSAKSDSKLREARIYVTKDSRRDVLKIESEVFIGTVTTELEAFAPAHKPAVMMARLGPITDPKRPANPDPIR